MNLVPRIIQLISGAVGGNIAGGLLKKLSRSATPSPALWAADSAGNFSAC